MKIKKGDKVKILIGKDQGKEGTVDRVFKKQSEVLVGGLNVFKKHQKPRGQGKDSTGGITDVSMPLPVSKVILICPKCHKETRVGYKKINDQKNRFCKKCQAEI